MHNSVNNYSDSISFLYKEMESIKTTALKGKSQEKNNLNSRIDSLVLELKTLKHQIGQDSSNEKINANVLNDQIEALSQTLEVLRKNLPTVFKAENHDKKPTFKQIYDSFVELVVNGVNKQIRGFIFAGATQQRQNKKLPAKLESEKKKLQMIGSKGLQTQIDVVKELEQKFASETQRLQLTDDKNDSEARVQLIDHLKEQISVEQTKLVGMEGYKSFVEHSDKIQSLEAKLEKVIFYKNKRNEMRKAFTTLGGEPVDLLTSDKVKLDGMFLSAQDFRKSLKDAGCELVTITMSETVPSLINNPKYTAPNDTEGQNGNAEPKFIQGVTHTERKVQMISMNADEYDGKGKDVMNALKALKAFSGNESETNAGWTIVHDGPNYLFVRSDDLPEMREENDHPLFYYATAQNSVGEIEATWHLHSHSDSVKDVKIDLINDEAPASSTIILSSGNSGVYEAYKDEALSYLFRNINVVLFNFRGYGESEGDPTEVGLNLDMEAAYQMGKSKSGHDDNKIIFKAVCMGGGPASYVASKHPETNIFLDQSYSDFKTVIQHNIREKMDEIDEILRDKFDVDDPQSIKAKLVTKLGKILEDVMPKVIDHIAPDYKTAEQLAKNNGQKVIFYVHDDELTTFDHVERNIKAIAEAGKMDHLMVISGPGDHGTPQLSIKAAPLIFGESKYRKEVEVRKNLQYSKEQVTSQYNDLSEQYTEEMDKFELMKDHKEVKRVRNQIVSLRREYETKMEEFIKKIDEASANIEALEKPDSELNSTSAQVDRYLDLSDGHIYLHEENERLKSEYKLLGKEKINERELNRKENKKILSLIIKVENELKVQGELIKVNLGPDALKIQNTTKNQIDFFLNKFGFSDNLLKSDTQLKQSNESHFDRSIKEMNAFINEYQDTKMGYNDANVVLPEGVIDAVVLKDGEFMFQFVQVLEDPNQVSKSEMTLPKGSFDKIVQNVEKSDGLAETEKMLKSDLLNLKVMDGQSERLVKSEDEAKFQALKSNLIRLNDAIGQQNIETITAAENFVIATEDKIQDLANLIQSDIKLLLKELNQPGDHSESVLKIDEYMKLIDLQLDEINVLKNSIVGNELLNLYAVDDSQRSSISTTLESLSDSQKYLEQIKDLALSAKTLPIIGADVQTAIQDFKQEYAVSNKNLKVIDANIKLAMMYYLRLEGEEDDHKYKTYTDEDWDLFFQNVALLLDMKEKELITARNGNDSVGENYKLVFSQIEDVNRFEEVSIPWNENLNQHYDQYLEALKSDYTEVKTLQKEIAETRNEIADLLAEAEAERKAENQNDV